MPIHQTVVCVTSFMDKPALEQRTSTLNGHTMSLTRKRVVASIAQDKLPQLEHLAQAQQVPYSILGEVRGTDLSITHYLRLPVSTLRQEWRAALARQLNV